MEGGGGGGMQIKNEISHSIWFLKPHFAKNSGGVAKCRLISQATTVN